MLFEREQLQLVSRKQQIDKIAKSNPWLLVHSRGTQGMSSK